MRISLLPFLPLLTSAFPTPQTTCGTDKYTAVQLSAAKTAACNYFRQGSTAGGSKYPEAYQDREGFTFGGVDGPYFEFPILNSGKVYSGVYGVGGLMLSLNNNNNDKLINTFEIPCLQCRHSPFLLENNHNQPLDPFIRYTTNKKRQDRANTGMLKPNQIFTAEQLSKLESLDTKLAKKLNDATSKTLAFRGDKEDFPRSCILDPCQSSDRSGHRSHCTATISRPRHVIAEASILGTGRRIDDWRARRTQFTILRTPQPPNFLGELDCQVKLQAWIHHLTHVIRLMTSFNFLPSLFINWDSIRTRQGRLWKCFVYYLRYAVPHIRKELETAERSHDMLLGDRPQYMRMIFWDFPLDPVRSILSISFIHRAIDGLWEWLTPYITILGIRCQPSVPMQPGCSCSRTRSM
ncbi:ribonuclease-domain-containing protein [Venturia nashicola]|uniref:Ribonuclease-domain-containing protein n=1 Tax=Venturia nashicola TaxID=86259 RepID=A0A4Z1P7A2_9PEZI|nr:ribonuclease-domain-containing protein [Venturia nashicola]TLD36315.1 ribonuclease-domain-containing protein [Venturia nashicola]